ncbi:MAG: alpha/beta fold hydrolase [Propionicimonas sp.]|nr:alpha/beta fold hydrolase [Propionicimonas sp.]
MPVRRVVPATQDVRFTRAPDGVRIAYAVHGSGPPLLISTCWVSQLLTDWESPVWRHFLRDLGRFATVVRFDERGHGLSDWEVTDYSHEARLADLVAVADDAGFDRFALMAMSQGGPIAVDYAVRFPERVTRLVFYDSYAVGQRDTSPDALALSETLGQLVRVGWGRPEPTFRRVFTSLMIPEATEEQMRWLDDLQKVAASAETVFVSRKEYNRADVTDLLSQVTQPTLVLHATGDQSVEFEEGRHLASGIPNATLVPLDSNNHILLEDEPAWAVFVAEVERFLAPDRDLVTPLPSADLSALSERELDVVRLVAQGLSNEAIADALVVSLRTVERHLQNVYTKLGLQGRSARAAAVARLLARG